MTLAFLSEKDRAVLDYHRRYPEPCFAYCLIGTSCIQSLDELDEAYAELVKARQLVAVGRTKVIDRGTGLFFGFRSTYQSSSQA
jgi:hypothetical protein